FTLLLLFVLEDNALEMQAIVDYPLIQISAWTTRIVKKNPNLVSRIQIGSTFENRPMHVLKRGTEKAIFIDCGIHAREWISPAFCQWFLKEVSSLLFSSSWIAIILIVIIIILKSLNFFVKQDRFWRKNRSNTSNSACIGVDLNRNFDVAWEFDASENPCEEVYCGSSPESEQETKVVTAFIRSRISSIKAYLTMHSYSQMVLFPYGYTYEKTPNHDELNELAKRATEAIGSLYGKKYKYGTSATTIYPSSGCSDDWAYNQGIKYSFTFELRDKGRYGFLLPESQIKSTCQETMLALDKRWPFSP
uniref:Peptidase M14 domain-containing protein n=1 Tax=Varanus komodoensis TaxID=61221 RepID=A0A8D2LKL8_VARKO